MIPGQTQRSAAAWARKSREERAQVLKAEHKHHRDYVTKHYVYRCWDKDGALLYIGCTMDLEGRINVHRSSWSNPASVYLMFHMDRYQAEPEPYIGRVAGHAAEVAAIEAERPLLNLHHNKGRGLKRVPAQPATDAEKQAAMAKLGSLLTDYGIDFTRGGAA